MGGGQCCRLLDEFLIGASDQAVQFSTRVSRDGERVENFAPPHHVLEFGHGKLRDRCDALPNLMRSQSFQLGKVEMHTAIEEV